MCENCNILNEEMRSWPLGALKSTKRENEEENTIKVYLLNIHGYT